MRKILVYEDALADAHPALDRALQLARQSEFYVKVIDVVDAPTDGLRELHRPMRSLVEQERKERLDDICERLREQRIEYRTELIRGRPFVEIVREVVHEGFHLVIKRTDSKQTLKGAGIMGAVDMRLVRNCPCPVWLEAHDISARPSKQPVMVAVDAQADDQALNASLIAMAASLTNADDSDLHLVSAWSIPDEEFLSAKLSSDKFDNYVADVGVAAKSNLNQLMKETGNPIEKEHIHFHKGDASAVILDCVRSEKPAVLVMGTVGQDHDGGLLIGNTADAVLRQIDCSVLAVKPDTLFRV